MPTERTSQGEANQQKDNLQGWKGDPDASRYGNTNFNPQDDEQGIDPGKPGDPNKPTPRNMNQDESNLHPVTVQDDVLKSSGRHVHGGPNEPAVSIYPTSGKKPKQGQEPKQISDANKYLLNKEDGPKFSWNQQDMDVGHGLLIPLEPNQTIDQVMFKAFQEVKTLNDYWSVPDLTGEGEEISDLVIVHELKRNLDKTVQLDEKSKPVTGANQEHWKRRIPLRKYVALPV